MFSPYKSKIEYDASHARLCMRVFCKRPQTHRLHKDGLCEHHYKYEKDLIAVAIDILDELLLDESEDDEDDESTGD